MNLLRRKKLSVRGAPFKAVVTATALVLAIGGISTVSSATTKAKAMKPYNVVIVASLSGASSSLGLSANAGYQAVFDTVNAAGGVKGHKIRFQVLDDQSSTTVAQQVAIQAVSSKPTAIMDGTTSSGLANRMPTYETAKRVVLSNEAISFGFFPWLYSDVTTTKQSAYSGYSMAKVVLGGSLQGKKVAFVAANTPADVADEPVLSALLQADGATLSTSVMQPLGAPSFTSGAANIIASGAQDVILFDTPPDGIVETNALRSAGYTGPITSNWGAANNTEITTLADSNWYGQYIAPPVVPGTVMYKTVQKFHLEFGLTGGEFGKAWGLAYMLVDALKTCGFPCGTRSLEIHLNKLGKFTAPGNAQFGPYEVSGTVHNVLLTSQLYTWNATTKTVVRYGKPFSVGAPY